MPSNTDMKRLTRFPSTRWLAILFTGMALAAGGVAVLPFKVLGAVLSFLLFIGFSSLAIIRFEQAMLIAIFLAPVIPTSIGLGLSDSLPLITGQRAMLLILYLAFAFQVISNKVKLPRLSFLTWLTLVVYIGSSVVTSLFSTLPLQSFYRVLASLFDNVGFFIIITSAATTQKARLFVRRALLTLWASFTTLAILGFIDTLTGFNLLYYLPVTRGTVSIPVYRLGIRRGQGLLPNPTALAVVIAMGIVLTLSILTWQKNSLKRKNLWVIELVNIAALIGTLTRTAWLVALIGIAIWLFYTKQNRIQLLLVILIVSTVLVITGVGGTLYLMVLAGADLSQQTEISTLLSRVRWTEIVWTNINVSEGRLLFGFGPGSVEYLTTQWSTPGFRAQMTSDYLIRLAEGGLFGLISFVGVLFGSIRQCRRLIRSSDPWIHAVGTFFFAVFAQMALSSLTLPIFVWAQTTYLFWIFWGILVTIRLPSEVQGREKRSISWLFPVTS